MAAGIDRERRHALIRQQNRRLAGMADREVEDELHDLARELTTNPSRVDDGDWLLWLCLLAAHRANRLEVAGG